MRELVSVVKNSLNSTLA